MYLRDPTGLRHIKGRDTLTKNDIVEEFNNMHVQMLYQADDCMQEYKD